jgi:hypothetical protein
MSSGTKTTPPSGEQESQPTGDDHLELLAADIAQRNGRTQATDEDRKLAYEEMKKHGQPAPPDEPAPH